MCRCVELEEILAVFLLCFFLPGSKTIRAVIKNKSCRDWYALAALLKMHVQFFFSKLLLCYMPFYVRLVYCFLLLPGGGEN